MYVLVKGVRPKLTIPNLLDKPYSNLRKLNPTSHGISDSRCPTGGASEAPPQIPIKESFLTLYCYRQIVDRVN